MKKPFTVALIGCGKIGWKYDDVFLVPGNFSHAAAIAANPCFRLAAVCDSDAASAGECGARYRAGSVFSSVAETMESGPFDVIVIASPPGTHLGMLKAVISAPPKVVVLEKPLASNLHEAREVLALGGASASKVVLNYSRRFSPEITSGLAKFAGQECRFSGTYSGGLVSNGTHWFDMLQMAGFRTSEVRGIPPLARLPGEDFQVDVVLRSESGSSAVLQMLPAGFPSTFDFMAMSRTTRFRISNLGFELEESYADRSPYVKRTESYVGNVVKSGEMGRNLDRLYENVGCILQKNEPPICGVKHGLLPLEIALAAKESAERGGVPIRLPL
jgi:hypothetical protein